MDRSSLVGLAHYKNKDGILVIESPTAQKANEYIAEVLSKYSDSKTALFLSGGSTPRKLYEYLAIQKNTKAGAVGLTDERFGENLHRNSNELMIKTTGLLDYFGGQNIRFYSLLEGKDMESSARDYDEALRFIFKYFPKSVGFAGIGSDGHTAGIPAIPETAKKIMDDQSSLVSYYDAEKYGQRITMNFQALSMLDLIIILVLGQEKREIMAQMFKNSGELSDEDIQKFPAKFYLKPEIAAKTILITDQIV